MPAGELYLVLPPVVRWCKNDFMTIEGRPWQGKEHMGKGFCWIILWLWTSVSWALPDLSDIQLPPGFRISFYATGVPNARSLALGPAGTLFVGTRTAGRVYALVDEDGDGAAERRFTIAKNLDMPNGVAFKDGALYVAESGGILRFDRIEQQLRDPPTPKRVIRLPAYRHHGWRYLRFGPDDHLYVPLGAPCNVCDKVGFASILRLRPDGSKREVFASGVRNTVGFDWHPTTKELWFTDNGRDWLGDNQPPDELNNAPRPGLHFGFPYCHGGSVADPEFGKVRHCDEFVPPVQRLGAHVAALGMRFYTGEQFPKTYHGQLFVAEHGSWNRSEPVGYQVSLIQLKGNKSVSYQPFARGWLGAFGRVSGRPVDLLVMPDGALLVSDDKAGVIYRIYYQPED